MKKFFNKAGKKNKSESRLIGQINRLIQTVGEDAEKIVSEHGMCNDETELLSLKEKLKKASSGARPNIRAEKTEENTPSQEFQEPIEQSGDNNTEPKSEPKPEPKESPKPEAKNKGVVKSANDILADKDNEAEEIIKIMGEKAGGKEKTASEQIDPFQEPMKKREYAVPSDLEDTVIPEDGTTPSLSPKEDIPDAYIPKPDIAPPKNEVDPDDLDYYDDEKPPITDDDEDDGHKEPINPGYSDLSSSEKRKAAKQTAEMFLAAYCEYIPELYKWIANKPFKRIDKLSESGDINLDVKVIVDGSEMTIKQYFDGIRVSLGTVFLVSEESRAQILEPLVEVLMQKGVALTPMQRLLWAVAQDQLTKIAILVSIISNISSSINQLKEAQAAKIDAINKQTEALNRQTEAMEKNRMAKEKQNTTQKTKSDEKEEEDASYDMSTAAKMAEKIANEDEEEFNNKKEDKK